MVFKNKLVILQSRRTTDRKILDSYMSNKRIPYKSSALCGISFFHLVKLWQRNYHTSNLSQQNI